MKEKLLLIFVLIISTNSYCQIVFENGYYITNSNQKIECLIKNNDWSNNPTDFEYKISENEDSKKINIKSVKEFGVYSISKYIRETVKIDRSSEDVNKLKEGRNPILKEEQLFLKVLVDGKSILYEYVDGSLTRYFYSINKDVIEQLIHKTYITPENSIGTNNRFRQQLWDDLKCANLNTSTLKNINYKKSDLVKFFENYSNCYNHEVVNFEKKNNRNLFNLNIRSHINNSSLIAQQNDIRPETTDFGNKIGIGIGVEAEFILPFNKNKWGLIIEPTYQYFKTTKTAEANNVSGGILISKVDYSSIEIPIGVRHYFFINIKSKIFLNASIILDLNLNKSIEFKRADGSTFRSLDINTQNNFSFGVGYKNNNKFSLELRYQTGSELLANYSNWRSDYKTVSMILGYSIF